MKTVLCNFDLKNNRLTRQTDRGLADIQIVMYVVLVLVLIIVVSSCNRCVYRENLTRQGYEIIEVEEGSDEDYSDP